MSTDESRERFIRSYLTEEELTRITAEAKKAADLAVPTYSHFFVGACILTQEGEYIYGCNIENISYTQTVHAEGCAISKAISAQKKNFKAVAVYAKSANFDAFCPPCGECRQFLSEFANFLPVILVHESGALMFEALHELLPLSFILGASAPKPDAPTGSKYDALVSQANQWILKDVHPQTRSEMRELLRDWKFDEILELTKGKIQFNESGVLSGKFRPGPASINHKNVQELFEAIALAETESKGPFYVAHDDDKVSHSLAHRIVATLHGHGKPVHLVKSVANAKGDGFTVSVTSKGTDSKEYEIKVVDGKGAALSKEHIQGIYGNRDKLLTSKILSDVYDYRHNRLLSEEKFISA